MNKKVSVLRLVCVTIFIAINLFAITFGVQARVDVTASTATFSGLSGTGSFSYPYLIKNYDDLYYFMQQVNKGASTEDEYFSLQADINLYGKGFQPIGSKTYPFKGTFMGNNHTISNLTYNATYNYQVRETYTYIGLFGYTAYPAVFYSVNLGNVDIDVKSSSSTRYVGGLIGYALSTTVQYCRVATGSIKHESSKGYVGGLIGYLGNDTSVSYSYNESKIYQCSNSANVSSYTYAGGIVCYAYDSDNSKRTTKTKIDQCANTGNITLNATSEANTLSWNSDGSPTYTRGYAGGIAGYVADGLNISDCFNNGYIKNKNSSKYAYNDVWLSYDYSYYSAYLGGIVGYLGYGSISTCFNNGYITTSREYKSIYTGNLLYRNENSKISFGNYYWRYKYTYSSGVMSGAIVGGSSSGSVTNCYYKSGTNTTTLNYNVRCIFATNCQDANIVSSYNYNHLYGSDATYHAYGSATVPSDGGNFLIEIYTTDYNSTSWSLDIFAHRTGYQRILYHYTNPLFSCALRSNATSYSNYGTLPNGFSNKIWGFSDSANSSKAPLLKWRYWEFYASPN